MGVTFTQDAQLYIDGVEFKVDDGGLWSVEWRSLPLSRRDIKAESPSSMSYAGGSLRTQGDPLVAMNVCQLVIGGAGVAALVLAGTVVGQCYRDLLCALRTPDKGCG